MSKNPVLKNTKWTAVQEEFVADAGTMTITYTLEFISDKEVRVHEKSYLPPYPAIYMNPDGTIDTMPGHSSETSETGTYSYRRGKLTITTKDGQKQEYTYRIDGTFVRELPWGELVVFSRSKD
ncbi:MAG: hypothetical protein J6Y63_01360 [Bacteroidales bacterium]|nr:hypothetical protein [Bacteroidales bacterium]